MDGDCDSVFGGNIMQCIYIFMVDFRSRCVRWRVDRWGITFITFFLN